MVFCFFLGRHKEEEEEEKGKVTVYSPEECDSAQNMLWGREVDVTGRSYNEMWSDGDNHLHPGGCTLRCHADILEPKSDSNHLVDLGHHTPPCAAQFWVILDHVEVPEA